MAESERQHVTNLLEEFDTAMLITKTEDGQLRARPMIIADKEGDAEIWFVTDMDSPKVDEVFDDPHVNVTMQTKNAFVSISGMGEIVRDRAKIDRLWSKSWDIWFREGKTSPNLCLVKVRPATVEYWDNHGTKGARYAWEAAKAYVHGHRPNISEQGLHGTLKP